MYHSIRWRLIFSYAALTLLTVLLIGLVALSLVSRYMADREKETLALNAEAVARMAAPLLTSPHYRQRLQQLAVTSGFLTNTNVTVLDGDGQALADSNAATAELEAARAAMSLMRELSSQGRDSMKKGLIGPFVVVPGRGQPRGLFAIEGPGEGLQGVVTTFTIERRPGLWGDRLILKDAEGANLSGQEAAASSVERNGNRLSGRIWNLLFNDPQPRAFASGPAVTRPVTLDGRTVGYVEMTNRFPLFVEPLQAVRRSLFAAGLGAVLLAVLLGLLMSRTLTAPLMALQEATRGMEEGDLTVRAAETGGEIGDVSRRFNSMASRLQQTFAELAAERDSLRRFIADASHELRTPLTALRQFVEILQGDAGDSTETRRQFLAESQRQVERLQLITGRLLDLSRLDGGVASLELGVHDAAALLDSVLAPFRPLAQSEGIELRLTVANNLDEIYCDRTSLALALANLLDNAFKFTPRGGAIHLAAVGEDGAARLTVSDSGPGVPAGDRDRIFERFARGQDSGALPGAGLGLAIVRSAVEAHGGEVRLEEGPGAVFSIALPAPPSAPRRPA